jgi:NAD-dependent SIR2 family protein deacetylase
MSSQSQKMLDQIKRATQTVGEADALLISAGAGMGVDSGLPDYRGTKGFWNAYHGIGNSSQSFFELANMDMFEHNPLQAWAFYGQRLNQYRDAKPHSGFQQLLEVGRQKPNGFFVMTSNVDGQFQIAGFEDGKIEECHGSIHYLQCSRPCSDDVWDAKDVDIFVDEEKFQAMGDLPRYPRCAAIARPNILMFYDGAWVNKRTKAQEDRLWVWLEGLMEGRRLVIVEIGAGTVISTIRQRSEYYASLHFAPLIRINPNDYHVSSKRHISLPLSGIDGINSIC